MINLSWISRKSGWQIARQQKFFWISRQKKWNKKSTAQQEQGSHLLKNWFKPVLASFIFFLIAFLEMWSMFGWSWKINSFQLKNENLVALTHTEVVRSSNVGSKVPAKLTKAACWITAIYYGKMHSRKLSQLNSMLLLLQLKIALKFILGRCYS